MEKTLNKLKRHELLEILLEYSKENEALHKQVRDLEQALEDKLTFEEQVKALEGVTKRLESVWQHTHLSNEIEFEGHKDV